MMWSLRGLRLGQRARLTSRQELRLPVAHSMSLPIFFVSLARPGVLHR